MSVEKLLNKGWSDTHRSIDLDESAESIKVSAGRLGGLVVLNMSASVLYIKLYNKASGDVTVGTDTPKMTIPVPTNGDTNGSGFVINFGIRGIEFSTAITIAATTDLESNGAPSANDCIAHAWYE
jgi:hypothetical protein